ncbi:hypothetical protein [Microbispora sp. NPDC049633]|uniref:hypothetical protein n=1 Tax=Microbispora sp. NPDC049633 TaxID=3154355 RepID=UPI00344513B7
MRLLRTVVTRLLLLCAMVAAGAVAGAGAANAAVPDVWGFAYVNVTSGVPSMAHQAGSWAAGNVSVSPGVPGEFFVRFPQIGIRGGVAHVTAVSQAAEWCQLEKWGQSGSDEIVAVRCYRYGGGPAPDARFTIVFASSSGPLASATQAFGYVHSDGRSIVSDYNSSLAANTVVHDATGVWTVTMPGLGATSPAGNIQVTAVDSGSPARCKVGDWSWSAGAQKFRVLCHNATTALRDTGWTLTYQRERAITGAAAPPRFFAYTFDHTPGNAGPYAPAPAGINFNNAGAVNTVQSAGLGLRLVRFPAVGSPPDDVQVTAFGAGPGFCNLLTVWGVSGSEAVVRDVACYSGGVRAAQQAFVTYTSKY